MKIINWLKKKENFVPIILFILAVLPFIPNTRDFFLSDDWDFLTQVANPHQPLWHYLFTNYVGTNSGGSYRPLTIYFWLFIHHFWQLNYFWYHLAQLLLHAADAVLLYLVVLNFIWPEKQTDRFVLAAASSAVFILLPNHAEAVAWIAAVCDPLCAFFYLASLLGLLFCLRYFRARFWLYAASLLFFLAALFSKEMAMSLPFIILFFSAYRLWQKRDKAVMILFTLPYFLILAGYFWLRYRAIGLFFGYYGEEHLHFGLTKTLAVYGDIVSSFVLSDYWRTIFSLWLNDHLAAIFIIFALFLAGLGFLTWKKKWSVWPWLVFASLAISLVPVADFGVNLTKTYFSEEGERYGYLPSLFAAILIALAFIAVWKKIQNKLSLRVVFIILIMAIAAGLGGQLLAKNQRYEVAGLVAQKALANAVAQMKQGDYVGALFFGLPDNFHGAPIFRNGWQEAIAFYLPKPPIILSPFNRTAYQPAGQFAVTRYNSGDFDYYDINAAKSIIAKPNFSSADYATLLNNYIFEPGGSNDRYFGNRLSISLSRSLAANPGIGLFFWNGASWTVMAGQP